MRRWLLLVGFWALAVAFGWWVVQVMLLDSSERANVSSFGQFVLAVLGMLLMIADKVVRGTKPLDLFDQDAAADALALAMRGQWEKVAVERRLLQPAPLPIRWRSVCQLGVGLAVGAGVDGNHDPFEPLPGLERVTGPDLAGRAGTLRDMHSIYGGLPSGRMLITGDRGAGKSSAGILLLLEAIRFRARSSTDAERRHIPVPVLLTVHGWDPDQTLFDDWLVARLAEIPLFAGRRGTDLARAMLEARRIAVFLDGLDEIAEGLRPIALQALSEQATVRLVMISRRAELDEAARNHRLAGATVLELQLPTAADVADFLLRSVADPTARAWRRLTRVLVRHPRNPLTRALATPLTVGLLRDVYSFSGSVDELLVAKRFPDPQCIVEHLLDAAIDAAYARRPGQPSSRYTADTARRTLAFIAHGLNRHDTHDLAWWQMPSWIPREYRNSVSVIGAGIFVGLSVGLGVGIAITLSSGPSVGSSTGILGGIAAAMGAAMAAKALNRLRPSGSFVAGGGLQNPVPSLRVCFSAYSPRFLLES